MIVIKINNVVVFRGESVVIEINEEKPSRAEIVRKNRFVKKPARSVLSSTELEKILEAPLAERPHEKFAVKPSEIIDVVRALGEVEAPGECKARIYENEKSLAIIFNKTRFVLMKKFAPSRDDLEHFLAFCREIHAVEGKPFVRAFVLSVPEEVKEKIREIAEEDSEIPF